MKKLFFAAIAVVALLSSCEKPNKCKCTVQTDILGVETKSDHVIARPEDKNCSQIKVEDIKGDIISVDLSKLATIKCVNHFDE